MAHSIALRLKAEQKPWWLIVCLAAYLLIHWMQHQGLGPASLRFYAKDILFMPTLLIAVELGAVLVGRQLVISRKKIWGAWLYVCLVFEGILPLISHRYHADYADILSYGIGAWIYWALASRSS